MDRRRWPSFVADDVRAAFDSVPLARLMQVVQKHLPDDGLVAFLSHLVGQQGRGLRQGGALSPLLLNLYLHQVLDRKWVKAHPDRPLLRYADDPLVLCESEQGAREARGEMEALLKSAATPLKGEQEQAVKDARQGWDWLGLHFQLMDRGLEVTVAEAAWGSLRQQMEELHLQDDAALHAEEAIRGWVSYLAPSVTDIDVEEASGRVELTAGELDLTEGTDRDGFRKLWRRPACYPQADTQPDGLETCPLSGTGHWLDS